VGCSGNLVELERTCISVHTPAVSLRLRGPLAALTAWHWTNKRLIIVMESEKDVGKQPIFECADAAPACHVSVFAHERGYERVQRRQKLQEGRRLSLLAPIRRVATVCGGWGISL
jgi:hypothetical protein